MATGLIVAAIGGGYFYSRRVQRQKPAPVAVQAPAAPTSLDLMGRITPRTTVLVAAPIEGTLDTWFIDIDHPVFKEQLLGHIHSDEQDQSVRDADAAVAKVEARVLDLETQLTMARLEVSRTAAELSRAQNEFERLDKTYQKHKQLYEAGAMARLAFEKSDADYKAAKADFERAAPAAKAAQEKIKTVEQDSATANKDIDSLRAAAEKAKAGAGIGELHSPVDGIVVAHKVGANEKVDPSMKDLVEIATGLTELSVLVSADAVTLARIRPGQQATVQLTDGPVGDIPGIVREVREHEAVIDFTAPEALKKSGGSAQVKIKL